MLFAPGYWLFAIGYWLLAIGYWLLIAARLAADAKPIEPWQSAPFTVVMFEQGSCQMRRPIVRQSVEQPI
jgi:hypothetical protein